MNRSSRRSWIVIVLALLSAVNAHAEMYYKEIRKSVAVNENVTIDLDLNFAEVNIQTWNQASAEIVVKMDVSAKSESRAQEMFENFEVSISESRELVNVRVGSGSWSCGAKGKYTESFTVRVEIRMPLKANLDGKCAFGDVNITDMAGACKIDVEYADARINGLWSYDNDFRIAFGNARINGTNGGDFRNEYGSLEMGLLQGKADIHSSFGDLEIDKVAKECKDLEVKVEYADADIDLAADAGFAFEANSSYGEIDLPAGVKKSFSDSDYTSKRVRGTIGSGDGKLELDCDFGDLELEIISN